MLKLICYHYSVSLLQVYVYYFNITLTGISDGGLKD